MIELSRSVRTALVAAVLVAPLLAAGCSSSSVLGRPDTSGARADDAGGAGSGGSGGGSGGLHVQVLKTGVVPLIAGTASSGIAIYAQLKNTGTTSGALLSWTGYGADGAKLRSDTADLGPQSSALTLPAGKAVYAILANPFTGKTPKRVTVRVEPEDPAMSDDALTVSPVRVVTNPGISKIASVTARHPSPDGTGGDSWGAVVSLDLICTSASGDVTGAGFLKPTTEYEQAPSYAKPLEFRGEVADDVDVSPQRCAVSPYEWAGGV